MIIYFTLFATYFVIPLTDSKSYTIHLIFTFEGKFIYIYYIYIWMQ